MAEIEFDYLAEHAGSEYGGLAERQLPDGTYVSFYPLLTGGARLAVEHPRAYLRCATCYAAYPLATTAADETCANRRSRGSTCAGELVATTDGRDGGYDEAYDYTDYDVAVRAFGEWDDAQEEPEGWYRHKPSDRRRRGGDPEREEVRA